MSRFDIYGEIEIERGKQDRRWGGPTHDDSHNPNDWVAYIVRFLGRTTYAAEVPTNFRSCMVIVAALAIAAIESYDRKFPRIGSVDECDCQNPEPETGVALVSESCPIHNFKPNPS